MVGFKRFFKKRDKNDEIKVILVGFLFYIIITYACVNKQLWFKMYAGRPKFGRLST